MDVSKYHLKNKDSKVGIVLEIEVVKLPAMTVLGLSDRYISAAAPESNAQQVISPLWDAASELFFKLDHGNHFNFNGVGATWPAENGAAGEMVYFAGYSKEELPNSFTGLEVLNIPESKYATVTHSRPLSELPQTIVNFYTTLLPTSGLARKTGMDLEIYGENDERGVPTRVMICAPVS